MPMDNRDMDSVTLPSPKQQWMRSSLASPLPEAEPAAGTVWQCAEAQTRTCSLWACDQYGCDDRA